MEKYVKNNEFQLGSCYYPEHWPEELWEDDYKRMVDMDFSTVRMGEFAWSIFEPNEGEFQFGMFDRAIDLAHQYGIKVVLGTPTATPPAWLTYQYPEILNVTQDGIQYQHGQRRHYNYNSKIYRMYTERIVRKMVNHYKDHPAVIGWQIDNELNCETNVFYSEADHQAFRKWVKDKYKTLDNLNEAWGTVFWSQTFTDWNQVFLTRPTPSASPNPHHALDEKRFFSDSAISFAKLQADIIHEIAPHQWVTTNGMFGHLNNHQLTDEVLDFFVYDSYPNFSSIYPDQGEKPLLDRKWAWNLSNVRSISQNFAVFEQQSGPGGWVNRMEQPTPKPGQMRLWTYQSIAHGADILLYFRWRTATKGTEIYWHGINDYHNQENQRVREAKQIGAELKEFGNLLKGSKYQAEIALLHDYDNEWDGELDLWHGPLTKKSQMAWFKACQYNHIPLDVLYLNQKKTVDDLLKYKLLIYPHAAIMTEATAALLQDYVEAGGTIVFGCRTGYKDQTGQCYMKPFPGVVREWCGISVEEFSMVGPNEKSPTIAISGDHYHSDGFYEVLKLENEQVEVVGRYTDQYYQGSAALTKNSVGNGRVYYFGGVFTESLAKLLLDEMNITSPMSNQMKLPEDIELAIRKDQEGQPFIFLLNYSNEEKVVVIKEEIKDLLSGILLEGQVLIEPFGVRILR